MPKNYQLYLKGGVGGWNFSSDMVNYVLDKYKDSEVHVLVNSLGGDAYEGLAISSLFKLHGNVHVHFIGANASAATIAAMGAKRVTIDADACFLVHKALSLVWEFNYYNPDQLEEYIAKLEKLKDDLDTISGIVATMYAKRCKKTKEELLALMKKDSWMTAQEALDWGFVDEVTDKADDKTGGLSENTVAAMADAGMPLPPNMTADVKKTPFFKRLVDFVNSLTSRSSDESVQAEADATEPEIKLYPHMSKLTRICALVGASIAMTEEKLFLTEEQVNTIEASLEDFTQQVAGKDSEIADLKAQIAEKDKAIADLKAEPAEQTTVINDAAKGEPDPYAPVSEADAIAAAKAFMELSK